MAMIIQAEYRDLELLMGQSRLPEPCLRGLDWFRANDGYTYRHILMVFALSCLLARRLGHSDPDGRGRGRGRAAPRLRQALHPPADPRQAHGADPRASAASSTSTRSPATSCSATTSGDPEDFTARVARDHHERRDGSGYPRGIALADQLVEIVAVCDVYDALVSPRPYRSTAFDNRSALEELTAMAEDGRIGRDAVRLLVSLNRKDHPPPERCAVSLEKRGRAPDGNLYGVFADGTPLRPPRRARTISCGGRRRASRPRPRR